MATAAPKRDYYEVLGVASDADVGAIKDAFRKLALRYHPDRNKEPGAEERFKEIAEAYAVLSNPAKRAEYDARGFAGISPGDLFGEAGFESIFRDFGIGESIFDRLFGGVRRGPRRAADIEVEARVPLERIARGGEEILRFARRATCGECGGTGAKTGTRPRACAACGGSGRKVLVREEGGVHIRETSTCPECFGRGHLIEKPCPACAGSGTVRHEESLTVKIPSGAEEGLVLRVRGKGETAQRGELPGDLLVVVRAAPDPRFERDGADLWATRSVDVADAVLGTEIVVPSLEGPVSATVPAGTQPGACLRLREKGLPRLGGRGDLYIRLDIKLPERVHPDERKLWEELRAMRGDGTSPVRGPRAKRTGR